jgi:hypothetical protein
MPKPLLSKTEITKLVKLGRVHECFTHSIIGTFDVTLMNEVAPYLYQRFQADITPDLISQVKATRDWDAERVANITIEEVLQPTLWILDTSDNTHILIDGTHRIIASLERFKFAKFHGYMATLADAIRPANNLIASHDWGRIEVKNGKLYNRETGKEIK